MRNAIDDPFTGVCRSTFDIPECHLPSLPSGLFLGISDGGEHRQTCKWFPEEDKRFYHKHLKLCYILKICSFNTSKIPTFRRFQCFAVLDRVDAGRLLVGQPVNRIVALVEIGIMDT